MSDWLQSVSRRVRAVHRVPSKESGDCAEDLALAGKRVLSLKGAPYWSPPAHVLDAARRAAAENINAPSAGFPELRRAIAHRLEEENGIKASPDTEILITNGAMHALSIVFTTLLDPGDEVLMFQPGFFFFGIIELAGGVPVYANTRQDADWRWDGRELDRMVSPRTKAILLSSPTNPTGYVADENVLEAVAEVACKHDLLIISDECYDRMVYDGAQHRRVASVSAARDRTITICSGTKSYAMQPWRLGLIVAPPVLTECFRNVLEWNVLTCSHVAQRAAQAALEGSQEWIRNIGERFERCRNIMVEQLAHARGISFAIPKGGPFLFINTEGLALSGAETSRLLLHEYGVPSEPGTLFGSDRHIRLSFGGTEETVAEAGRQIVAATQSMVRVS